MQVYLFYYNKEYIVFGEKIEFIQNHFKYRMKFFLFHIKYSRKDFLLNVYTISIFLKSCLLYYYILLLYFCANIHLSKDNKHQS